MKIECNNVTVMKFVDLMPGDVFSVDGLKMMKVHHHTHNAVRLDNGFSHVVSAGTIVTPFPDAVLKLHGDKS